MYWYHFWMLNHLRLPAALFSCTVLSFLCVPGWDFLTFGLGFLHLNSLENMVCNFPFLLCSCQILISRFGWPQKMNLKAFTISLLWKYLYEFSLSIWNNSPVNPSRLGVFFVQEDFNNEFNCFNRHQTI